MASEGDPRLRVLAQKSGDFFVFLTSADRHKIPTPAERNYYITMGLLMLLSAGQGFYVASVFAAQGFRRPASDEWLFGLFFALAVLLIDRSIISHTTRTERVDRKGRTRPGRPSLVVVARLIIATSVALLLSEIVLLQFFAPDIAQQARKDHIVQERSSDTQISARYAQEITYLRSQVTASQKAADSLGAQYAKAEKFQDCQEYGCPGRGIPGGEAQGFQAAQKAAMADYSAWQEAQKHANLIADQNGPKITQLNGKRLTEIAGNDATIGQATALLTREEAFWQLTEMYGTVAAARVLLSLLLLGVDLAPLLMKLSKSTQHDESIRAEDRTARREISERALTREGRIGDEHRLRRDRSRTEAETELQRILADADVERFGIRLGANHRKMTLRRRYQARWRASPAASEPRANSPAGTSGPDGTLVLTIPVARDGEHSSALAPVLTADNGQASDLGTIDLSTGDLGAGDLDGWVDLIRDEDTLAGFSAGPESGESATEIGGLLFETWSGLHLGGKWVLLEQLQNADAGSQGMVWRAKNTWDSAPWYVVKTISAEAAGGVGSSSDLRQRGFRSEVRMLPGRSGPHPPLVRGHDRADPHRAAGRLRKGLHSPGHQAREHRAGWPASANHRLGPVPRLAGPGRDLHCRFQGHAVLRQP